MNEYEQFEKEKNSSISVERNAKGLFNFKVKLYWSIDENEDAILQRIKKIYDKLEATYKNGN